MPWITTVNKKDDLFHPRTDDPYWNESHLNTFRVPEANLMGTLYYYFRPNMNLAVGGPIIWNGDGEEVYNCLYYAWDQCMAMPADIEMNEFALPNGLSVQTLELQTSYRMTYEGPGCEIDLTWTALMEPHYMVPEEGKINPGIEDWMTQDGPQVDVGHYEQAGMMRGTVKVGKTLYDVDHTSLRDHTWGPRKQLTNMNRLRGAWPFVVADENSSFQAYAVSELSLAADPIIGTTERVTSGWYMSGGIKGNLVAGTRRCERDADGRPLREIFDVTDHLGRTCHLEGRYLSWLKNVNYSDLLCWWGLVEWEYDGQSVYGECTDWLYANQNRKLHEILRDQKAALAGVPQPS